MHSLTLSDGRKLSYALYGASRPKGAPMMFIHGFPGSHRQGRILDEAAKQEKFTIIAVNRPGYHESSPHRARSFASISEDCTALLDHLGYENAVASGISGGGPYALALTRFAPERFPKAGLLSSLGPIDNRTERRHFTLFSKSFLFLGRKTPSLARLCLRGLGKSLERSPESFFKTLMLRIPDTDKECLKSEEVKNDLLLSFREAMAFGIDSLAEDLEIYSRPWSFRPEEIEAPVLAWHGTKDTIVPFSNGRLLASRLKNCEFRAFEGHGHYSVAIRHAREFLQAVRRL